MKQKIYCLPIILLIFLIAYLNNSDERSYIEENRYNENNNYYNKTDDDYEDYNEDYNDDYNDDYDYDYDDDNYNHHYDYDPDYYDDHTQYYDNHHTTKHITKNANLNDIYRAKDRINIYLFWGDGCPHCEHEFEFLESIDQKYADLFNLYGFEVWKNEENKNLMTKFENALNVQATGVPFAVIGDVVVTGFSEKTKETLKQEILDQSKKKYDIYFEKILKN